jgi:hypothetical protein
MTPPVGLSGPGRCSINASVVISGKNQTVGNASNADQEFGTISILGADATPTDTTLHVKLDNTARVDGTLTVGHLVIGDLPGDPNPIRTLELESAGHRSTSNVVTDLDAATVDNFMLSGTQDLSVDLTAAANTAAGPANTHSLLVDGTALTGDLTLSIDGGVLSDVDAGTNSTATLRGTAGTHDLLHLYDAVLTTGDTHVSGFETIQFGAPMGEDSASGTFDATNVSGVTLYDISDIDGDLSLTNLGSSETVQINTDNGAVAGVGDLTFAAKSASSSNVLNLNFVDEDHANGFSTAGEDFTAGGQQIFIQSYGSINMALGNDAAQDDAYQFDLNLLDSTGLDATDLNYNAATVTARTLTVTGGGDQGAAGSADGVDTASFTGLTNVLSTIDFSHFTGEVTASVDLWNDTVFTAANLGDPTTLDRNVNIVLGGYGADLTEHNLGTTDTTIVNYVFTKDAVATTEDVTITGFNAFNVAGVDLTNLSILDLSALGVTGLAGLTMTDTGTDTIITSNQGLNFEIDLVGVALADLSNENFKFAA